jgi:hypothetical protein
MANESEAVLQKIYFRLELLDGETSPEQIKVISDQIKKFSSELARATYEKKGKLGCREALPFLEMAKRSFANLAGDLKETAGKLDAKDSRRPVLRSLSAMMERLAGEMQEAYHIIDRINRY